METRTAVRPYTHGYTHASIHLYTFIHHTHTFILTHTHISTHRYNHTHILICMHPLQVSTFNNIKYFHSPLTLTLTPTHPTPPTREWHTHIYIHTHTYIHTSAHTHTYTHRSQVWQRARLFSRVDSASFDCDQVVDIAESPRVHTHPRHSLDPNTTFRFPPRPEMHAIAHSIGMLNTYKMSYRTHFGAGWKGFFVRLPVLTPHPVQYREQ